MRLAYKLVLGALPERLKARLERNVPAPGFAEFLVEADGDAALERCEEIVIAQWRENPSELQRAALLEQAGDDLERYLERQIVFEALMEELERWLDPADYADGETLAGAETPPQDLQLLVAGRVSAYDSAGTRQHQRGPGDAVWPVDAVRHKIVAVVADGPCRTLALSNASRDWLETHRPGLALKLYRYLLAGHW